MTSLTPQLHHAYVWRGIREVLHEAPRGELLDAGCGDGFISSQLMSLGYKVTGIDSDPELINRARSTFPGIRFDCLSLYDDLSASAPDQGWDVILSCEVIEHLFSPSCFLKNVTKYLKPAGRLVLTTPYHGYLKNVAISVSGAWDRHHSVNWEGGHIKFYSRRTLTDLLTESGFEVLRCQGVGRIPLFWKSMICEARKASTHP